MLVRRDPLWKESVQKLMIVITAVLNKLIGDEGSEPTRDHFNRVMREVKIFCKDPMKPRRFERETYELAMRMTANEALERIIMKIDTIDDVDKNVANQILQILEPEYARPEPIEKINCMNQKFLLHIRSI